MTKYKIGEEVYAPSYSNEYDKFVVLSYSWTILGKKYLLKRNIEVRPIKEQTFHSNYEVKKTIYDKPCIRERIVCHSESDIFKKYD